MKRTLGASGGDVGEVRERVRAVIGIEMIAGGRSGGFGALWGLLSFGWSVFGKNPTFAPPYLSEFSELRDAGGCAGEALSRAFERCV